jgi:hypothetical protein
MLVAGIALVVNAAILADNYPEIVSDVFHRTYLSKFPTTQREVYNRVWPSGVNGVKNW